MKGRLFEFAGRLSLALLLLCAVFHATFLAMAFAVEKLTDPPACKVAMAFPLPYAICPGFGLDPSVEYAMALPGAVLALPLLLPGLVTDASSAMEPYVIAPFLLHILGWGYLIVHLITRKPKRYR